MSILTIHLIFSVSEHTSDSNKSTSQEDKFDKYFQIPEKKIKNTKKKIKKIPLTGTVENLLKVVQQQENEKKEKENEIAKKKEEKSRKAQKKKFRWQKKQI